MGNFLEHEFFSDLHVLCINFFMLGNSLCRNFFFTSNTEPRKQTAVARLFVLYRICLEIPALILPPPKKELKKVVM